MNSIANGDWTLGTTWSDGLGATAGKIYTIDGETVSSPTTTNSVGFAASRINLQAGILDLARLHALTTQTVTYTLPTLSISDGATLRFRAQTGSNIHNLSNTIITSGNVTIRNNGGAYGQDINLNGPLQGSGTISYIGDSNSGSTTTVRTLKLSSTATTFSGNWFVDYTPTTTDDSVGLSAGAVGALGTGSVTLDDRAQLIASAAGGLDSLHEVITQKTTSQVVLTNSWTNTAAGLQMAAGSTLNLGTGTSTIAGLKIGNTILAPSTYDAATLSAMGITATGTGMLVVGGTVASIATATTQDVNGATFTAIGLEGTGGITNSNAAPGTLAIRPMDARVYAGVIDDSAAGTISLIVDNFTGGSQTLAGANNYRGTTTFSRGTVEIGAGGVIPAASDLTVNNGATLRLTGTGTVLSNNITLASGTTLDLTARDSIYTLVATQSVKLGHTSGTGNDVLGDLGTAGATIDIGGIGTPATVTITGALKLSGGSINFDVGSALKDQVNAASLSTTVTPTTINILPIGLLTPGDYNLINYTGGLSGSGLAGWTIGSKPHLTASLVATATSVALNISSVDTLLWTGATTSTWDNAAENWKLASNNTSAIYLPGDVVLFDDSSAMTNVSVSGTIAPARTNFANSAVEYTFNGGLSGFGSIVKSGDAAVILTGTNQHSGGTMVSSGTIKVSSSTALGTGAVTIGDAETGASNAALLLGASGFTLSTPINVSAQGTGKAIIGTAAMTTTSNSAINSPISLARDVTLQAGSSDRTTFGGPISGIGGVIIESLAPNNRIVFDPAATGLVGSNSFSGDVTLTNNATLQIGVLSSVANRAIPDASIVQFAATNAKLRFAPGNSADSETVGALNSAFAGAGLITKENGTGTFTLTIGGGNKSGDYSGTITNTSGALALTKIGTGQQTFSGTEAYTGGTTVSGGTLQVSGAISGTTAVTLNTGGTLLLSGSGNRINDAAAFTLAGGLLKANGTAEGDSSAAGLGTVTVTANSILDFGETSGSSLLHFAGSAAQSWGAFTLAIYNWDSATDHLYFGLDNAALTSTQLSQIQFFSDAGLTSLGTASFTPANIGELTVIPEPSSFMPLIGGTALLALRRRRRS